MNIKTFKKFNESIITKHNTGKYKFSEYPLNERLVELFNKYNDDDEVNWDELPWIGDMDVLDSMKRIKGNGELKVESYIPSYVEHFDKNIALVVHGYAFGLTGKSQYRYEIKVVNKNPKSSSQIGGGYETSGIIMHQYSTFAWIVSDDNPQIFEKDFIGNVINEFRIDIINFIQENL